MVRLCHLYDGGDLVREETHQQRDDLRRDPELLRVQIVPTPEDAEEEHGHQDGRGGRAAATTRHALHALGQQPQVQQAEAYARPEAAQTPSGAHTPQVCV
jgi:hypothetical protein